MAEIERALTIGAKRKGKILPYGLKPFRGSGLGAAWDNFDRFVKRLNGKDILHDTVGIVFQRKSKDPSFLHKE